MYGESWLEGGAIAWVVSRQFLAAEAWVQIQVTSCGICSGPSGTGVDFLQVLQFPVLMFDIRVIQGWYSRHIDGLSTMGLSPTHAKDGWENQSSNETAAPERKNVQFT
jgi:hypothetical protein